MSPSIRPLKPSLVLRPLLSSPSCGARTFTSTGSTPARNPRTIPQHIPVPPDAPDFIQVPTPRQFDDSRRGGVKGILPVPRQIIRQQTEYKGADEWINSTTMLPHTEQATRATQDEHLAWKRRMAEKRRVALDEGIRGLYRRYRDKTDSRAARQLKGMERNRRALYAPERKDEVLGRGSVPQWVAKQRVKPDPFRFRRALLAFDRREEHEADKAALRRDALVQLYVAAGEFIVDYPALQRRVNSIFTENYFKDLGTWAGVMNADNAWTAWGTPHTMWQMFAEMRGIKSHALEKTIQVSEKRKRVLAEELSGGKMDWPASYEQQGPSR